jgi:hypothetical protein
MITIEARMAVEVLVRVSLNLTVHGVLVCCWINRVVS